MLSTISTYFLLATSPVVTDTLPPPPPMEVDEIVRAEDLSQVPLFPGCEHLEDYAERKECADQKMVEFMYYNVRYPAMARENETEGTVIIRFIVEKDGRISNPSILSNPGDGTGEEALRVIKLINEKKLWFTSPNSQDKAVRVLFEFPINFRLS